MLLTKEVISTWNPRNKNRLIDLGYKFTYIGDKVSIKVEHLGKYDKTALEVLCDYCLEQGIKTTVSKSNDAYVRERRNVPKDTCNKCKQEKYKDNIALKQKEGKLKLTDKGYFNFKENRLKELNSYIQKFKTIDKMNENKDCKKLYNIIIKHNEKPYELALELGYELEDIMKYKPKNGYYNEFELLKNDIQKIINKLGRFPTTDEICNELLIAKRILTIHGGIYEIKRKMNYNDEYDLVDLSGFYNKSLYELITANFLIENNIHYLREQSISKDHNYRSDFTFVLENNEFIHVEVWGYLKSNKTPVAIEYNEVRDEKEKLYNQLNMNYISIEPVIFYKMNYNNIQESLINIFTSILKNNNLKKVDQEILIPSYQLSDQDLFDIAMGFSDDELYLPEASVFRESQRSVYNQILKRYSNYTNFAEKYNKKVKYKSNKYWTKEKVFEAFDYMINNYDHILSRNECKNNEDNIIKDYSKVNASFNKMFDGIKNLKLRYYLDRVSNKEFIIPNNDLKWIKQVEINLSRRGNTPYSQEQQEQAKQILEKYSSRSLTPTNK